MKFDGIKKVSEGRFIDRYDLYYTTEDDKKKVYEIISRNKDIKTIDDVHNNKTDGVVIVATDENDERILINKNTFIILICSNDNHTICLIIMHIINCLNIFITAYNLINLFLIIFCCIIKVISVYKSAFTYFLNTIKFHIT